MSDNWIQTKHGAAAFNKKAALSIGWGLAMPHIDVTQLDSELARGIVEAFRVRGPDSVDFAVAVGHWQEEQGMVADDKFGAGSWRRFRKQLPTFPNSVRIAGVCVPCPYGALRIHWGLDVDGDGEPDFLHSYSQGSRGRRIIALHWGGINAESCFNALANRVDRNGNPSPLSTHLGTERDLDEYGILDVYQFVDLAHSAYHGGRTVNGHSIGIDICRSVQVRYHEKYYPDSPRVPNPTNPRRGEKEIVDISAEYGERVGDLVRWMGQLFDIPTDEPYPGDRYLEELLPEIKKGGSYRGVLGHHHFSKNKWDIAPLAHHLTCWTGVEATRA